MKNASDKSKATAFVLAFFLGIWGAHRFYTGKTATAVTMLMLSLSIIGLLVTSIWATIDCIIILSGSFKDNDGKLVLIS